MKKKFQEENPSNARIKIKYGKKPNVKFEYINKQHPVKTIFPFFLKYWIQFNIFTTILVMGIRYLFLEKDSPNLTSLTSFSLFYVAKLFLVFFIAGEIVVLYFFGFPLLISYIFYKNKNLLRLMPHLYYFNHLSVFEKVFYPEDIDNKKVEIPLFKNIGLDYIATGDFSKYLKEVNIIEHDFTYIKRTFIFSKRKKKKNEYLWKAVFNFSQKPKQGKLVTIFK